MAEQMPWNRTIRFKLVGSALADVTPFAQQRMEFVVRLAYNVTRRFREVHE